MAYTLQLGRRELEYRRILLADCKEAAESALSIQNSSNVFSGRILRSAPPVGFLFSGPVSQHFEMGRALCESYAIYRNAVEDCLAFLKGTEAFDLLNGILKNENIPESRYSNLDVVLSQSSVAQPALFVLEYALSRLWESWEIIPDYMLGQCVGEYVAAHLAGVFRLEDALRLISRRGCLMQETPGAFMLAIELPELEVREMLEEGVSLAAVNGDGSSVVSGSDDALHRFEAKLEERSLEGRRLPVSRAFRSDRMRHIAEEFEKAFSGVVLSRPIKRFVSSVTGEWIRDEEATSSAYWSQQLFAAVPITERLSTLRKTGCQIYLEIGPGQALYSLACQNLDCDESARYIASLPDDAKVMSPRDHLLLALGRLWISGVSINWSSIHGESRRRIPLPTYPFERERYWVEASDGSFQANEKNGISDWFYAPSWKRSDTSPLNTEENSPSWLLFVDDSDFGDEIRRQLEEAGYSIAIARIGDDFRRNDDGSFSIQPGNPSNYLELLDSLRKESFQPERIVHMWSLSPERERNSYDEMEYERQIMLDLGFYSLVALAKAIGRLNYTHAIRIGVVSNGIHEVIGDEFLVAEKALNLGPVRVIPTEFPNVAVTSIDIKLDEAKGLLQESLARNLIAEVSQASLDNVVAYRGRHRWIESFEARRLEEKNEAPLLLKEGGVYLITGGFGGIGFAIARYLASSFNAKLVLIGRSPLPESSEWETCKSKRSTSDSQIERIRKSRGIEGARGRGLESSGRCDRLRNDEEMR